MVTVLSAVLGSEPAKKRQTRWYPPFFGRALDFYGVNDFPMLHGV